MSPRGPKRGRTRRLLPYVLLAAFLLAGCGVAAERAPVVVEWTLEGEPEVGRAAYRVVVTDTAAGRPVEGAAVFVEANMTHPGMVPVLDTARATGPGRYEGTIDLTMGGDWYVLVETVLPDGRRVEKRVDLTGVAAPRAQRK